MNGAPEWAQRIASQSPFSVKEMALSELAALASHGSSYGILDAEENFRIGREDGGITVLKLRELAEKFPEFRSAFSNEGLACAFIPIAQRLPVKMESASPYLNFDWEAKSSLLSLEYGIQKMRPLFLRYEIDAKDSTQGKFGYLILTPPSQADALFRFAEDVNNELGKGTRPIAGLLR